MWAASSPPAARGRGFTLLELLVALAVFAVLSVMAYGGLDMVLDSARRTEAHAERLAALQKTMLLMGRDLEQAVARPVRDSYGDPLPALVGDGGLELTRTGWSNPLVPADGLQRVAYRLEEGRLWRLSWPVLDRPQGSEPREVPLLDGVERLELRFLDGRREWKPLWEEGMELPLGVEVTMELEGWGRLRRLYVLPGRGAPGGSAPGGSDGTQPG